MGNKLFEKVILYRAELYYIDVKSHCIRIFKMNVSVDINDLVYNFSFCLFVLFYSIVVVENNIQKQERLDDMI